MRRERGERKRHQNKVSDLIIPHIATTKSTENYDTELESESKWKNDAVGLQVGYDCNEEGDMVMVVGKVRESTKNML